MLCTVLCTKDNRFLEQVYYNLTAYGLNYYLIIFNFDLKFASKHLRYKLMYVQGGLYILYLMVYGVTKLNFALIFKNKIQRQWLPTVTVTLRANFEIRTDSFIVGNLIVLLTIA
jgi:hypothetical protein